MLIVDDDKNLVVIFSPFEILLEDIKDAESWFIFWALKPLKSGLFCASPR